MSTPRSVAAARGVSLFASAPGSSLCLLVCLRVLLAGVLLGFSDSGCSSSWIVAVSFPGLVFCQWAECPCACLLSRFACGLLVFSAGWTVPFLLALSGAPGFQSFFSFSSAQSSLSLSLSAFLAPASRPWGFTGWDLCLSWLLSWLGLSLAISWWPTYWYPCVSFRFSSGRSFPPSWWGPALLLCWTSFQSVLLVYPGHSLLFLALSSSFCQVLVHCLLSSLWLGWCSASFPAACTRSLSLWPVGCSPISSVTVPSCVLSWSLGFSIPWQFPRPGLLFPGSRILQLPPLWYSRWHLDPAFCSSGVLHPTLAHVWSLVSVSCDGFSDCSVGSKVFSLTFLTLFSVALSPV